MSMNQEPTSFSAALHDAAHSFDPPRPEFLYENAVQRGRGIKRKRALTTGLAGFFALAAAGVLVATLAAPGKGRTVTPTVTATVKVPSGPVNKQYMIAAWEDALPSNATVGPSAGAGFLQATGVTGKAYVEFPPRIPWQAFVDGAVFVAGKQYVLDVEVSRESPVGCSAALKSCVAKPLDGGTLVSAVNDQGMAMSVGPHFWWNVSGDRFIELSIESPTGVMVANPFTEQQIEQYLTSPVWTKVLDDLPK